MNAETLAGLRDLEQRARDRRNAATRELRLPCTPHRARQLVAQRNLNNRIMHAIKVVIQLTVDL